MTSEQIRARNFFGWALGAVPTGLLAFIFSFKYVEFFYDDLQLWPVLFIIGQVIYMTINALNDPLSGQLSDRTNRERWGSRRIVYIKYGGPVWALTFLLVWWPWTSVVQPLSLNYQFLVFLHYVLTICLFDTMLTLVLVAWLAILPEMTESIDTRNKAQFLASLIGIFTILPTIVILGDIPPNSDIFRWFMFIPAVISTIFLLLTAFFSKEKPEFSQDESWTLKESLKTTFKSRAFLIYSGFYFCQVLLTSIGLSYFFIYILLFEKVTPGHNVLRYFIIIYIICVLGSYLIAIRLQRRWGMRKVILRLGAMRVLASLILLPPIIPPGPLESLLWVRLVLYYVLGGYGVFQIPMQFLAVDEDEVLHGSRREGMFIGSLSFLTKPAASIGPIIATVILTTFGYVQEGVVSVQPDSAFFGIKILFILVPVVFITIGLIFMYFYPLHGERLKKMQDQLKKMHKEKRAAMAERARLDETA